MLSSDVNAKVDCIRALRERLVGSARALGVPRERVDPLVELLDEVLARLRYVRSGDIVLPEDHNTLVDALARARDVLSAIEDWCWRAATAVAVDLRPEVAVPEVQSVAEWRLTLEYSVR